MNRVNFGGDSGILIDWCRGHGYWFDAFELEKVLGYVRGSGKAKSSLIREPETPTGTAKAQQSAGTATPQGPAGKAETQAGAAGPRGDSGDGDELELDSETRQMLVKLAEWLRR